ncbi:MAG: hypothetical protein ACR2KI_04065 [Candidatus Limnocylindria bacterium]
MSSAWRRRAFLAPIVLLVLLSLAELAPRPSALQLANPDASRAEALRAALAAVPADGVALVDIDADLGTYPEVRPAVRAALDQLVRRGVRIAVVSFSAEGRAIASAELDRMQRLAPAAALLDLGFRSGAEAGLVRSVRSIVPEGVGGAVAAEIRRRGGGLAAFDAALLIGGGEIGPRAWVEQVRTRVPQLQMVAIAPSVLQPELEPYRASGQLKALLATVRDDVAYVSAVGGWSAPRPGGAPVSGREPSALAILLGMLVAIGVLVEALAGHLLGPVGSPASRGQEER